MRDKSSQVGNDDSSNHSDNKGDEKGPLWLVLVFLSILLVKYFIYNKYFLKSSKPESVKSEVKSCKEC